MESVGVRFKLSWIKEISCPWYPSGYDAISPKVKELYLSLNNL